MFIFCSLTAQQVWAQTTPPTAEWDFDAPSSVLGFEKDDNWAFTPLQASDGSIISVGFSDKYEGTFTNPTTGLINTYAFRHPAILKYVTSPTRKIQWERIPTYDLGYNIPDRFVGGFVDLFESAESGVNYIYACGTIVDLGFENGNKVIAVIAKFDLETGDLSYFKTILVDQGISARFYGMSPVFDLNNQLVNIYLCGESEDQTGTNKGTIFKLEPNGELDLAFGQGGYKRYDSPSNSNLVTSLRDLEQVLPDGLSGGLIAVGTVTVSSGSKTENPDRDIFMVRVDGSSGNLVSNDWPKVYTETSLISSGLYIDLNSPEQPICVPVDDPLTSINESTLFDPEVVKNEQAFSIKKMPDGNFAVLCQMDFVASQDLAHLCAPFDMEELYDNDIALLKVDAITGQVKYSLDIGRSVTIDGWNTMDIRPGCSDIYVNGNNFVPAANSVDHQIQASLYKVEDTGTQFVKKWESFAQVNHKIMCSFGMCLTTDGGAVVVGNNAENGDDYEFVKFAPDYQNNTVFNETTQPIIGSVNWNTSRTVRGVINIAAGGKLTISGANTVIQFADTYKTNNWYDLANGTGSPTKIVVQPGGKLILDGCTLTGLTSQILCPSGNQDLMWEGIELLGLPSLDAIPQHQGLVEMKNDAKIQNPYRSINVGRMYYNSIGRAAVTSYDGGGLVSCQNPVGSTVPHFYNCRFGIWFGPALYPYPASYAFENTNFICDQPMVDPIYISPDGTGRVGTNTFVGSWDRDGLSFENCRFENSAVGMDPRQKSIGAGSFDATISYRGCNFKTLLTGLTSSYGTDLTEHTDVTGSAFDKVWHSVIMNAGTYHDISSNTFSNILANSSLPASAVDDPGFGVRFIGSQGVTVEGNSFTGETPNDGFGVVITDSQTSEASLISNNSFTGLHIGIQTEQENQVLEIRCNSFTDLRYAWSINPASAPGAPNLFSNQGECGNTNQQAGNKFYDPACPGGGAPKSHIRSMLDFKYRHRNTASAPNETPTCVSNDVNGVIEGDVTTELCNISNLNGDCGPGVIGPDDDVFKSNSDATEVPVFVEIGQLLDKGDWEAANLVLANATTNKFNQDELDFYYFLIDLVKSSRNVLDMTKAEETMLFRIAASNSFLAYNAQNILTFSKGYVFEHPIERWEENPQYQKEGIKNQVVPLPWLALMPNPAQNVVNIYWEQNQKGIGSLLLCNVNGVVLFKDFVDLSISQYELSLNEFPKGIYFVRLSGVNSTIIRQLIIN
jgi:Secretion system C-terminal sorting domain